MFRPAFTRSTVSRSVVVVHQLHASPVVGKTVTEKVTEVADKVCTHSRYLRTVSLRVFIFDRLTSRLEKAPPTQSIPARRWWILLKIPSVLPSTRPPARSGCPRNGSGKNKPSFQVDETSGREYPAEVQSSNGGSRKQSGRGASFPPVISPSDA